MSDMLNRNQVIAYVGANASKYGLDPAAVIAVAAGEGLNTAPGSHWVVPGEPLPSFGPPSWYGGGAGNAIIQAHGSDAYRWAWTPEGIDYWLKSVAQSGGTVGTTGGTAIAAIVQNFERPASQYVQGNINNAINAYQGFQNLIGQLIGQIPLPPGVISPPVDGEEPVPGSGNAIVPVPGNIPDQTTSPGTGGATNPEDVRLGTIGPFKVGIPSGLILGLLGVSLLLIGAILFVYGGMFRMNVGTVGGSVRKVGSSYGKGYSDAMKQMGNN